MAEDSKPSAVKFGKATAQVIVDGVVIDELKITNFEFVPNVTSVEDGGHPPKDGYRVKDEEKPL